MRLEGWHVMVLLAALVLAAVVAGVTLVVLWALRLVRRRNTGGSSGVPKN